jgi:hypothetical protein
MTVTYLPRYKDMMSEDYTDGTLSLTNNSTAIVGSGTTFTSSMEGRWLKVNSDGYWYRISSVTDSTNIVLSESYKGVTSSGEQYTIGESPDIPEELHEILPYRAAQMYFLQKRASSEKAVIYGNLFYTGDPQNGSRETNKAVGGILGAKRRYASRSTSPIVKRGGNKDIDPVASVIFGTSITT